MQSKQTDSKHHKMSQLKKKIPKNSSNSNLIFLNTPFLFVRTTGCICENISFVVLLTPWDEVWLVGESCGCNGVRRSFWSSWLAPLAWLGGTTSGIPGWWVADEEEDPEEEEEQDEDEAEEGLRGGSGGGGGDPTTLPLPLWTATSPPEEGNRSGDELWELRDRLRAGKGGGTSHPGLSHPPPSAAPSRIRPPAAVTTPLVRPLPKWVDSGRLAGDGDRWLDDDNCCSRYVYFSLDKKDE